MSEEEKVAIVACAGIDKALGSVTRACAFKIMKKSNPEDSVLVSIPPLVIDATPHSEWIKNYPAITIDGCTERCATKIAVNKGGRIRGRVFIPQSIKKHGLKPKSSAEIGPEGEKLAEKIAEEVVLLINRILGK